MRIAYRSFVARHEVAWELGFALLAIVYVAIGFAEESPTLVAAEWSLTAIFAVEFFSRLAAAADRRAYLRGHWVDIIALVPPVRGLRILRLLRLLRLVRALAGVARAMDSVERLGNHRGLVRLLAAWIGVMIVTSLALYVAENGVNDAVTSPLDALWWGVTTMTTVGYGDVYPVTAEGRIAATALMVLGIGLFSAITAIVTSFLIEHGGPVDPIDQVRRLDELRRDGLLDEAAFIAKRDELLRRL